ncbi:MAG: hypothetical protein JKY53_01400 [Flavobacteriales bacterium]|nr:hypothetical protein [Flavobacteriales bacterium]
MKVRKSIFWDTDFEKLSIELDMDFVIHRVLTRGNIEEFKFIFKTYTKQQVINAISGRNNVDGKTINFLKNLFDVDVSKIPECRYQLRP